ncbi:FAD-binding oxidoreductase [Gordonia aichiensis]|uniref:FAD-binding oxidoreductase n=2 Tax=Gordonia TaxID=2053 RepID=UPI003266045F
MPTAPRPPTAALVSGLTEIVGRAHVLTDAAVADGYRTDWTGAWHAADAIVVRPADTEQVAAVLDLCRDLGACVSPQGGNTGLVGGSQPEPDPSRDSVILSLRRLDDVGRVDSVNRCVAAGAGAALAAVQSAAAAAGLEFGVDLAARDSATIGGMVATNAGGIRMIRHGDMRAQIVGIEAVLASGAVLRRWRPLRKDNVGYDLPGLLAGSEGTLAVITRVLLRLVVPPARTAVAMVAVDSVPDAQRVVDAVERSGAPLEAAELMTAAGIALVTADGRPRSPLTAATPFVVLVEAATDVDGLSQTLSDCPVVRDAAVEAGPARRLWAVREQHTESIARATSTPIVKLDVSAPLDRIGDLVDQATALAFGAGARPILFGHLGDGNVHVNLLDVPVDRAARLTDEVLRSVDRLGGSVSAEHGIGRAKRAWLLLGRDETDRAMMAAVRAAWDPTGMLNPGAIFG